MHFYCHSERSPARLFGRQALLQRAGPPTAGRPTYGGQACLTGRQALLRRAGLPNRQAGKNPIYCSGGYTTQC